MEQGFLFNIQKFSIHDGDGIRTTLFFKGCPLACKWCSNPESQESRISILHDASLCKQCLVCRAQCPTKAIRLQDGGIRIDPTLCNGCNRCVHACTQNALSIEGKQYSVAEVVAICLQDIDFYAESNGGITFSGGEAMCQKDFVKALVKALKKHHLHIAIETTGYVCASTFHELAPLFDLILFDVKHYDSTQHYRGTNVKQEQIIENLTWALQQGLHVLPRIPVIPEFNNSLQDALYFSELFQRLNIPRVQLLPFHQFGEKKYDTLHKTYAYKDKKALYPEDLKDYQRQFLDHGIDCFF